MGQRSRGPPRSEEGNGRGPILRGCAWNRVSSSDPGAFDSRDVDHRSFGVAPGTGFPLDGWNRFWGGYHAATDESRKKITLPMAVSRPHEAPLRSRGEMRRHFTSQRVDFVLCNLSGVSIARGDETAFHPFIEREPPPREAPPRWSGDASRSELGPGGGEPLERWGECWKRDARWALRAQISSAVMNSRAERVSQEKIVSRSSAWRSGERSEAVKPLNLSASSSSDIGSRGSPFGYSR